MMQALGHGTTVIPAIPRGRTGPVSEECIMSTQQTTAAYKSFVSALKAKADEMGIPLIEAPGTDTGLPENKGWVRFESTVNGHKIYVPKSQVRVGMLDTTLPVGHLNGARDLGAKRDGTARVNGKIMCRFMPDVDLVTKTLLPLMADPADRLPANRLPNS